MKIVNNYVFNGSRQEVFELLQEAEVLKNALPGAQQLERTAAA